jgi:hypothetical protein
MSSALGAFVIAGNAGTDIGNIIRNELRAYKPKEHLLEASNTYLVKGVESSIEIEAIPSTAGAQPFLDEKTLRTIISDSTIAKPTGNKLDEHRLIVCFTPFLCQILNEVNNDAVVINSEEYQWLKQCGTSKEHDLKPDLVIVFRHLYESKPEPETVGLNEFRATINARYWKNAVKYVFGIPLWDFLDSIQVIIEWKSNTTPADNATMYRYLMHLSSASPDIVFRGLLCDAMGFIYVESISVEIRCIKKMSWLAPGSKDFLKKVFSKESKLNSKWIKLLQLSLTEMQMDVVKFLGGGSFGRVFHVKNKKNCAYALKIILTDRSDGNVIAACCGVEYAAMSPDLPASGSIVNSVPGTFRSIAFGKEILGMSYLLEEIGTPLDKKKCYDILLAFTALSALHSARRYHGDARIENAVKTNARTVKWIDFMQHLPNESNLAIKIKTDIEIFKKSLHGHDKFDSIDGDTWEAYYNNPSSSTTIISILSSK